jgi:hypothetical protein
MKTTVFWNIAPCILVEVYRRFRGAYCLYSFIAVSLANNNLYEGALLEKRD